MPDPTFRTSPCSVRFSPFPFRPPRCLQSAADNGLALPHLYVRGFSSYEVPLSSLSCCLPESNALIRSQRRVVLRAFAPRRPRSLVTHHGLAYCRRVSTKTTLNCNAGYWQVPLAPEYRDKITFTLYLGTYRYNRMPFGLRNAPATFPRTLDISLSGFQWQTCLIYLDDVIVFSKEAETHLRHVDEVLQLLRLANSPM